MGLCSGPVVRPQIVVGTYIWQREAVIMVAGSQSDQDEETGILECPPLGDTQ